MSAGAVAAEGMMLARGERKRHTAKQAAVMREEKPVPETVDQVLTLEQN